MEFKKFNLRSRLRGQSLLEALLAIALGAIVIGGSVGLMGISLRVFQGVRQHYDANTLLRQTSEIIIALSQENWHNIYDVVKNSDYKITASGTVWLISSGQETSSINNIPYKRYFQVANVNRDASGNIAVSGADDPSTQKISVFMKYGNNYVSSSSLSFYLTRSYNAQIIQQTDWSGGDGVGGPVLSPSNVFLEAGNISY